MTQEEQIKKASSFNLGTKSREEFKSRIILSLERKFVLGNFNNPLENPWMIWTIEDNRVKQLVAECITEINNKYRCEFHFCSFDAKVSTLQEFKELIRKTEEEEYGIFLVENYTYGQGELWRLLYGYLKGNSNDDYYMIATSPLESLKEDGTNWDNGLMGCVTQSVLLSE